MFSHVAGLKRTCHLLRLMYAFKNGDKKALPTIVPLFAVAAVVAADVDDAVDTCSYAMPEKAPATPC
jgi:hypothetical protein